MHSVPLLRTKLFTPPPRPDLVPRPRLIQCLDRGLPTRGGFPRTRDAFPRALTLISAPAGFGKTTLVSEWVHQVGARRDAPPQIAWLSLDEGDNDPTLFLTYVVAALRTLALGADGTSGVERAESTIGGGALVMLQSAGVAGATTPPPTEAVLTSLINEITALPDKIVLVLDDYHLIEAQPIHDALAFLLDHLPPQMHLVIATREDPHLPFARLRARGQVTELRAADLRFSSSEAAEFLNQVMGLDLSAEDIAALETRTEGWIAGLQLAAISMQGRKDASSLIRSFTSSNRYVLDYLIEEVLDQQSESIQAFLLRTSILDRLCGPLCDAVCFVGTASSSKGTAVLPGLQACSPRVQACSPRVQACSPRLQTCSPGVPTCTSPPLLPGKKSCSISNTPTCSSSPWMRNGAGTAITISLPICCAGDCANNTRIGYQRCTTRPASGTSRTASPMRR